MVKRYTHKRIASPSKFKKSSFRTISRGGKKIVVGKPKGSTKMRAQSVLTPKKRTRRK